MKLDKVLLSSIGLCLLVLSSVTYGQTCNSAIAPTASDSRYQNNGNGTVTDLYTGLMWQQCSAGQRGSDCTTGSAIADTWDQALQFSETLNASGGFAGYSDWRLPNRKELVSLVEEACYKPAINLTLFPNTSSYYYWSSSPYASFSNYSWDVLFYSGSSYLTNRFYDGHIRLVRTGI